MAATTTLQPRHLVGKNVLRSFRELYLYADKFRLTPSASSFGLSGSRVLTVGGATYRLPTVSPCSTSNDMDVAAQFVTPTDVMTTGSVTPIFELMNNANIATSSSVIVCTVKYNYINTSGCTTTTGSVQGNITVSGSSGYRNSGSIPNMPSFGGPSQLVTLQVQINSANASSTAGSLIDLVGLRLRYLAAGIGIAASPNA